MYVLFPCVSDTLAGEFLSAQLICRRKAELCQKNRNYFSRTLPTAKIKIREKYSPCFLDKTAKIWRRENIPLYGNYTKAIAGF